MQNHKQVNVQINPSVYRAIKYASKVKSMKIGAFIEAMFMRHKDEYLNEAMKPLMDEIDQVKELLNIT